MIPIDRESATPLHRQVYVGFREAILRGDLTPGQKVPSSRALADDLAISRFPVLDAYGQLLAEGYFESRAGTGTFVSEALPNPPAKPRQSQNPEDDTCFPSRRSELVPRYEPAPWRNGLGAFGVHQPALDRFPFDVWSRLITRNSRSPRLHAIHHIDPLGLDPFREAICSYLRTARGVRCDPSQIMIVSGSQQALDITARVLFDPGDPVWIEEPCYPLMRSVLLGSGCRTVPVPVDGEGLDVAAGIRLCRNARAAFVTPSHQYPLGATMTAARRLQLIEWAHQSGSWIVEDDYDSEYRFESLPVSSLQGLDDGFRVVYIGTFSKVLFPSLRLGYIVIPPGLLESYIAVRWATDIFPSYLFQEVLTEFINSGQFGRHIHRMRAVYKARRTALVASLRSEFGDFLQIHGAEAGMNLAVTLPDRFMDVEIATRAANDKLWLWPLSQCWSGKRARQGFILGFGNIPDDLIPAAVARLRQVIRP